MRMSRAHGVHFEYPYRYLGIAMIVVGIAILLLGSWAPHLIGWFVLVSWSFGVSGGILAFVLRTIERRPAMAGHREDFEEETEAGIDCVRCGFRNRPGLHFCGMCGCNLTEQTRIY